MQLSVAMVMTGSSGALAPTRPSEVAYVSVIGAPNAFLIAARNCGSSVSAVEFTIRGAIARRPAFCSTASLASMLG
jgi:hypothetical protein